MEGDRPQHDLAQLAVPDALDHEQVDADRRRDLPELDEDDEDDAEQDGIDAVARKHRVEQRYGNDDHPEALDQAAQHREERKQRQEELEPAQFEVDDEFGDLLTESAETERSGEDVGGEDQEQDVAAEDDVFEDRLNEAAQGEMAHGDAECDRQHTAHHGGFRGSDDTEIEPAQRAGDEQHEGNDLGQRPQQLCAGTRAR